MVKSTYVMKGTAATRSLDQYHLILAPTHACNLRCRHCYLPDHHREHMPLDTVRRIADEWSQIVEAERGPMGGYFHLKGGEPLILPYLNQVLDHLASIRTLRFMMTTNGTIMTPPLRDAFRRLNDALDGRAIIIVSLDGSNEQVHGDLRGRGNFADSEAFSRQLIADGLNVHFNYVVHAGNQPDVPDFIDFAERVGATQINFLPFVPKGYGEEMGEESRPDLLELHHTITSLYQGGGERRRQLLEGNYAHILDRESAGSPTSHECVAGYKGMLYVTPEGEAYACPNLVSTGLSLGNVNEESLHDIHHTRLAELYADRIGAGGSDDRYMCRGERRDLRYDGRASADSVLSLPVLGASTEGIYPTRIGQLQQELVASGISFDSTARRGTSYCFSRNF